MKNEIDNTVERIGAIDTVEDGRGGVFVYNFHGSQVDELSVDGLKALALAYTQLKADLARYEEFCRRQGYMYFNYKHTGRRMFWTEAGWELEPHSYDAESYIFQNALEAFSAVTAQGQPKNQTIATLDAIGKE